MISPETRTETTDAPEALVSYVLDALKSPTALPVFYESWSNAGKSPEIRRYIAQAGYEVAPSDLALRGKVIKAMLGLLAIEENSALVSNLESAFNSPDAATEIEPRQLTLQFIPGLSEII